MKPLQALFKMGAVVNAIVITVLLVLCCGVAVQMLGTKSSKLFTTVPTSAPHTRTISPDQALPPDNPVSAPGPRP